MPDGRGQSHLFTLRVWTETLGGGQQEWRGKVHHIGSGETRYFRSWEALVAFLTDMAAAVPMLPDRPAPKGREYR
jgi:hypothetical protein